ncbi:helix-turn-helix domain-containing protein [Streptomyces sp. NPDC057686]|uniref:TetR/AcrR family transcriptional regulator n=1 Tax=Streptomyces sp. NPDC057686 TaxID=3346212 RepID=UPI0036A261AE
MTGRGPRGERGEQADKIVAAARRSFATRGYAATSLRSVAQEAGIDPGPVNYYFRTKTGLLEEVMQPLEAFGAAVAVAAAEQPMDRRGHALVQATMNLWEDPVPAEVLRSIILTDPYLAPQQQQPEPELRGRDVRGGMDAVDRSQRRAGRASIDTA